MMAYYPFWQVSGVGFDTDPGGHWANHGCKHFDVTCKAEKASRLGEAIRWCREKFGVSEDRWEKDPWGGYQITGTIRKAMEATK